MAEVINWPRHLYGESFDDTRIANDEAHAQVLYGQGYQEVEDFLACREAAIKAAAEAVTPAPGPDAAPEPGKKRK